MTYDINWAKNHSENGIVPFWKPGTAINKHCLSQWFPCEFTSNGVTYYTAEQYMMAHKAYLFGDSETYHKIMEARDPARYKALGRMIKGFDEAVWAENRTKIVIAGNYAKFTQNSKLKEYLLSTKDKILVEASPYDHIWGIGLDENNPLAFDPFYWRGQNLLGFCLMEVRDLIKSTT